MRKISILLLHYLSMELKDISQKRQKKRKETNLYKVKEDASKPKFYILDMFPYPSGSALHVGHPKWYIATDCLARKKMLEGFNVLHPMGFDTFGLGTEQYAIEHKMKPQIVSQQNIQKFIQQLENFGTTYDRSRSVNTADPKYFKRTQRVFLQMYNHYYDEQEKKALPIQNLTSKIQNWTIKIDGDIDTYLNKQRLAYVDYKPINRCPSCMTGLANEDLDDGKCERCGSEVQQKPMKQRVLRITKYADRLLEWLDTLQRDESMKDLERNWIGRSEWTDFTMKITGTGDQESVKHEWYSFDVYTTRVDTVFWMSFVAIAPEHPLLQKIENWKLKIKNWNEIHAYQEQAQHKTQLERTELQKEKTWVRIEWLSAINPFNNQKVPIFVTDYVLANYGTWVVMAVPAHDERDFEFAKKYNSRHNESSSDSESFHNVEIIPRDNLPISNSILPPDTTYPDYDKIVSAEICYTEKWIVNNSWDFTGLTSDEAITKMQWRLAKQWIGGVKVNYKMQDRVFSRQRYRGEPFPILWTEDGKIIPLEEKDLPLLLPDVENYEPTGTEEWPLANITDWVNVTLADGTKAKRETNTMPGRAGSSRYRLRYMDVDNEHALVGKDKEKYRGNVDVYVGGAEHITRHMIYGRFRQKFLFDLGTLTHDEPFQEYHSVGLIMGEDGRKMSKRRGNVVNPDDIINEFGTDVLRTYEMFMWPFDQSIAWSTNGIKWVKKFLEKIVALKDKISDQTSGTWDQAPENLVVLHQTIKKLTEDIDAFRFNTWVSQLMILVNHLTDGETISRKTFEDLVVLISPYAPHLAEELREQLGNTYSLFTTGKRPSYDEKYLVADTVTIGVQINGKVRGTISISIEAEEIDVMKLAQADEKINARITSEPKKVIYVKGKILNIVI